MRERSDEKRTAGMQVFVVAAKPARLITHGRSNI